VLRQFLLATGERGLGWETVRRLDAATFEQLCWIQQRVLLASSDEGRATIQQEQAIRVAVAREQQPPAPLPVCDPETATPAQLADWRRQIAASAAADG